MSTPDDNTERGFTNFSSIQNMEETVIGLLQQKEQREYLNVKYNIQNVSQIPLTEVCYVAEDVETGRGDRTLRHDKYFLDIKNVTSTHIDGMELDGNLLIQKTEQSGSEEEITEEKKASCVCKCHCRRTFQRHGLTKKLKSTNYNSNNSDKLIHKSQRNGKFGVIKVSQSNPTTKLFKTRLKSDNNSERLSVGPRGGSKRYINLVCLRIKTNMAKILCHCVILLLMCLCGVVMVHQNIGRTDNKLIHTEHDDKLAQENFKSTPDTSILLDVPFRSVSTDEFQKHLAKSSSAAEMLKVFFSDPHLTEEQVNSIMFIKRHQKVYGSESTSLNLMLGDEEYGENDREIAYQHYLDFERSPFSDCSVPKPEVVHIEDTYSDSIRHYLPSCTVVNRCSNTTACCPRGYVCAPKKDDGIELVDKYVLVLERDPSTGDLRPAKDLVAAKTVINHKACECQKIEVNTNCRKECPLQFKTKTRPGVDCECICASGHRKCHKIQKGLHPLDESDLECIKEGRCILPTCHSGEFSVSTGFCPHFRRHRG